MASYTLGYADQTIENLNPELFPGEYAQFDGLSRWNSWNSLDCNLSAVRDNHHYQQYDGFNPTQYTIPHSRSFSSYDGVAHGFTFAPPVKRLQTFPYQVDVDTIWQNDFDRHTRYPSPLSSGTSLSGSDSTKSEHPLTPDAPKDSRYLFTSDTAYPSPRSEPHGEQSHPVYFQQSPAVISWNMPLVPSQPSFSMRDFELSPGVPSQSCLAAEQHNPMTTNAQSSEPLNQADNLKLEDTQSPQQDAESENDEPMAQDESCNESDFTPAHAPRQLLAIPLRSSTRTRRLTSSATHAVQDSNAHIRKSTSSRAKSKAKAARKRQASSLSRTATSGSKPRIRSFRCPFAAFGCESVFPTKNEWKRHTAAQHLQLGFYRCDLGGCSPSHPDQVTITKGHNDFNRKDLFTQHCRRMHWDECEGLQRSKVKGKEWATWTNKEKNIFESFMVKVRERCWVNRRGPPSQSECGVCGKSFVDDAGDNEAKAWEERMEHVGRHYERGEQDKRLQQDVGLREWCEANEMGVWIDERYWLKGCEPEEKEEKGTRRRMRGRASPPDSSLADRMGSARGDLHAHNDLAYREQPYDNDGDGDGDDDDTDAEGETE